MPLSSTSHSSSLNHPILWTIFQECCLPSVPAKSSAETSFRRHCWRSGEPHQFVCGAVVSPMWEVILMWLGMYRRSGEPGREFGQSIVHVEGFGLIEYDTPLLSKLDRLGTQSFNINKVFRPLTVSFWHNLMHFFQHGSIRLPIGIGTPLSLWQFLAPSHQLRHQESHPSQKIEMLLRILSNSCWPAAKAWNIISSRLGSILLLAVLDPLMLLYCFSLLLVWGGFHYWREVSYMSCAAYCPLLCFMNSMNEICAVWMRPSDITKDHSASWKQQPLQFLRASKSNNM